MKPRRSALPFVAASFAVWLVMVVILVLVPDSLEPWVGLEVSRVIGWAVAGGVWMISVEPAWRSRVGPVWRFLLQTTFWVLAALVAIWISEQAYLGRFE